MLSDEVGAKMGEGLGGGLDFDEISHALTLVIRNGKVANCKVEMDAKASKQDAEIENLCNLHYQDFVQSVDQLLALRTTANDLKNNLIVLHSDLQTVGMDLVKKKRAIIEQKRTVLNMEDAIETLGACVVALELLAKAQRQMNSRKFYAALKTLAELQRNHMLAIANFKFSQHMSQCIPMIKDKIKRSVFDELKEWLVEIRDNCRQIGHVAIITIQSRYEQSQAMHQAQSQLTEVNSNALQSEPGSLGNAEFLSDSLDEDSLDGDGSDPVDELLGRLKFRPLYQCLHIHEVLGKKNEFKNAFEEIRKVQCDLWLTSASVAGLKVDTSAQAFSKAQIAAIVSGLELFLDDVMGFFIMETIVAESTTDFRSKESVQLLWEVALNRIADIVSELLLDRVDPDLFLKIKASLLKFSRAIGQYGFSVDQLTTILFTHLQAMVHVMEQQLHSLISTVIDEDAYSPSVIETQKALDRVEAIVGVVLKQVDSGRLLRNFPRTLPFSKGFVTIVEYTKKFIGMFYDFIDGFSQYYSELNDLVKKSLEAVVSEYIVDALVEKLGNGANLSQAVQIIVNLEFLEFACSELEAALERAQMRDGHRVGKIVLNTSSVVNEAKTFGEMRIFEITNSKIDAFFELADYDWEGLNIRNKPTPFLRDMVEYLTTVVTSTLVNLPLMLRASIYFSVFTHICDTMKLMLLEGKRTLGDDGARSPKANASALTIQAVESFNLDLLFLESFVTKIASDKGDSVLSKSQIAANTDLLASSNDFATPQVSLKDLVSVLSPLRQLVDLLRSNQPEEILVPEVRVAKYHKVLARDAIKLLEKMKGETTLGMFAKSADKKKREKLESLIKQLKLNPI